MRNLLMAGAAALATATITMPATAQDMNHDDMHHEMMDVELTAEQRVMFDAWPMDRRMTYGNWPAEVQVYYWTLPEDRQNAFWMLNDEQRVQVHSLPAEQRAAAWTSITQQVNASASTPPAQANARARTTATANVRMNSGAVVQTIPAPHTGEYPPCRGDRQDNCINPREAGLNYGNRPLEYWPGRPASEIDGPLPAERPNR
ncbi:hypothetical protein [Erythrobacter alti]|uniref:hypothetical protein n=1 Tax=Erythrobacter alti TaxID=1896145 RepID=UPI0030F4722D